VAYSSVTRCRRARWRSVYSTGDCARNSARYRHANPGQRIGSRWNQVRSAVLGELGEPGIEGAFLAYTARPEPIDEYAITIGTLRRIVDALDPEAARRPAACHLRELVQITGR
jgi:hypothetical protein